MSGDDEHHLPFIAGPVATTFQNDIALSRTGKGLVSKAADRPRTAKTLQALAAHVGSMATALDNVARDFRRRTPIGLEDLQQHYRESLEDLWAVLYLAEEEIRACFEPVVEPAGSTTAPLRVRVTLAVELCTGGKELVEQGLFMLRQARSTSAKTKSITARNQALAKLTELRTALGGIQGTLAEMELSWPSQSEDETA
jgi:hypothetical protein